jgi:hypothetical protein
VDSLVYWVYRGPSIRVLGNYPALWVGGGVIAHPGICPPCGFWGCDGFPSTEGVLRSPGNCGAIDVSVLGGDVLPGEL